MASTIIPMACGVLSRHFISLSKQSDNLSDAPNVVSDSRFHRGCDADRLVDAAEVVVRAQFSTFFGKRFVFSLNTILVEIKIRREAVPARRVLKETDMRGPLSASWRRYLRWILGSHMPDNDGWLKVCAQAAVEQDPAKLIRLIRELNDLLEARRGLPPRVSLSQLQNDSISARATTLAG
jgi:hypothetical protein